MEPMTDLQYLSFTLDGECYAVSVKKVHEVLEYSNITRLPRQDSFMKGIINLRGAGVPVIDLRTRFGMPETPISTNTAIIVMEIENAGEAAVAGVLVDAVHEVVELPASDIEPPPRFGTRLSAECIQGIGNHDGGFVVMLDMDRVFEEATGLAMAEACETASDGSS